MVGQASRLSINDGQDARPTEEFVTRWTEYWYKASPSKNRAR